MSITNEYGYEFDLDVAVELMDYELCCEINGTVETDQEFFDAYCKAHLEKYGEEFELAKENPVW